MTLETDNGHHIIRNKLQTTHTWTVTISIRDATSVKNNKSKEKKKFKTDKYDIKNKNLKQGDSWLHGETPVWNGNIFETFFLNVEMSHNTKIPWII